MRYDLNILWVEDTSTYYEEAKDILEDYAGDSGISVKFHYIQDVNDFYKKMSNNEEGFKLYDIYFIDYSLSGGIVGSELISILRTKKIDADILFYSSDKEKAIRETIEKDVGSFEGVYVANKNNFDDKSYMLISKNAKRLTSLSNIRGYLMDQTSENDFTVKSYIMGKYDSLTYEQKQEIAVMLTEYIENKKTTLTSQIDDTLKKIHEDGINNINKIMGLSSELFPIEIKYKIFDKMVEFENKQFFSEITIDRYLSEIVKARNTLAHKKLDVCKTQKYILYYDTMKQMDARKCPDDCRMHNDSNKISIEEWRELRKKIHTFGTEVDNVQKQLTDKPE